MRPQQISRDPLTLEMFIRWRFKEDLWAENTLQDFIDGKKRKSQGRGVLSVATG